MLPDDVQLSIAARDRAQPAEVKYKIIMRLAERWGIEAFRTNVDPRDYCAQKFASYPSCADWGEVTKVVLTAFVIREHAIWQQFFREK